MSRWNFLLLASLLITAFDSSAQDGSNHPLLKSDWLIRLGGQQADADVRAGLANPELGEIPVIDFSGSNIDTTLTSFWGDVLWRASDRWSFGLSYFQAEAEGDRISDADISFGGIFIPAGTGVSAEFTTDFFVLNGYYDFYKAPDRSAGIGLGVYALDLKVSAQVVAGGQPTGRREAADTLAPLPTFSAYYLQAFNDKWALMLEAGFFAADIDKYDGDIFTAQVSLDYWINDNWGLGAGYAYVDLDLTVDEQIFDQLYEVEYDSFFLYATFGF